MNAGSRAAASACRATEAVPAAMSLIRMVRDPDATPGIHRALTGMTPGDLHALCVVLAALCPADTDPAVALAWCDLPPSEWPDRAVITEAGRYLRGARDGVAAVANAEYLRRARGDLTSAGVTYLTRTTAGGAA